MNTTTIKQSYQPETLPTIITWLLLIVGLSLNQFFITEQGEPPFNLLMTGVLSIGLFFAAYFRMSQFRDYVLNLDMRLLILLHSWRTLGLGFVMLYFVDELPALFAFPAGIGDALVALAAAFLAYKMFTNRSAVSKKRIWRWNTFALLDLIIAVSLGILTRTDALLFTAGGVSSDLMTAFPYVLIPAFLVQLFTLTHIIIYLQLKNNFQDQDVVRN